MNIIEYLKGKKAYVVAFGAFLTALGAWLGSEITTKEFIEAVFATLSIATLRAGIAKAQFMIPILALLTLTACANLETNTYRAIGATAVTVDQSMNGWGEYVRAGLATDREQAKVRELYERYQASMRVARAVVISAKSAPDEQSQYQTALDALDAARADLVQAILTFSKD